MDNRTLPWRSYFRSSSFPPVSLWSSIIWPNKPAAVPVAAPVPSAQPCTLLRPPRWMPPPHRSACYSGRAP